MINCVRLTLVVIHVAAAIVFEILPFVRNIKCAKCDVMTSDTIETLKMRAGNTQRRRRRPWGKENGKDFVACHFYLFFTYTTSVHLAFSLPHKQCILNWMLLNLMKRKSQARPEEEKITFAFRLLFCRSCRSFWWTPNGRKTSRHGVAPLDRVIFLLFFLSSIVIRYKCTMHRRTSERKWTVENEKKTKWFSCYHVALVHVQRSYSVHRSNPTNTNVLRST